MIRNLLGIIAISSIYGCASLYPLTGAMVGAGAGALGGPGIAALGSGAGFAMGEALKEGVYGDDDPAAIAEAVTQGLSAHDVGELITKREIGTMDKIMREVMGLLKLSGLLIGLYLLLPIIYTWHRKRKAAPFYDKLEKLADEVKEKLNS